MKQLLVGLLLLPFGYTYAQCPYYPADCPDKDYPNADRAEDSIGKLDNPLVPQEIAMENRLHEFVAAIMTRLAEKEHWDAVEITEGGAPGFRAPDESVLLYEKRPPHWFSITWQCIVNNDSLQKWKSWLTGFSERRLQEVQQYAGRQQSKEGNRQVFMDSANYYSDLKAKYMTDHAQQYQQAVLSNNKAGMAAYEKENERYDKKINAFVNKAATLQQDAQAQNETSNGDNEKRSSTILFHDASVVLLQFDFNMDIAQTAGRPVGTASVAGASFARYYTATPDLTDGLNSFTHSVNNALLLLGPWNLQADSYNDYHPSFMADKTATNKTTAKRIKCDQVQEVVVHLSGNKKAIQQCISAISWSELNAILVK